MKCCYALKLGEHLELYEPHEIIASPCEHLVADSRGYRRAPCESLGVASGFYDDCVFPIENRSRFHRNVCLRSLATRAAIKLEPLRIRVPAARRLAPGADRTQRRQRGSEQTRDTELGSALSAGGLFQASHRATARTVEPAIPPRQHSNMVGLLKARARGPS